jgi:hypothetical protein
LGHFARFYEFKKVLQSAYLDEGNLNSKDFATGLRSK